MLTSEERTKAMTAREEWRKTMEWGKERERERVSEDMMMRMIIEMMWRVYDQISKFNSVIRTCKLNSNEMIYPTYPFPVRIFLRSLQPQRWFSSFSLDFHRPVLPNLTILTFWSRNSTVACLIPFTSDTLLRIFLDTGFVPGSPRLVSPATTSANTSFISNLTWLFQSELNSSYLILNSNKILRQTTDLPPLVLSCSTLERMFTERGTSFSLNAIILLVL